MTTLTLWPQNGRVPQVDGKYTLRLDTSQLVQALKCPTFHDFVSVQNIVRKTVDKAAMDRGTVMHGLQQRYYQKIWEKEQPSQAMNYAISCLNDLKKDVKLADNDYARLVLRFSEYFVKYRDEQMEVATIQTPQGPKPAIELGFSIPLVDNENFYFVLEGRIDLIAIYGSRNVVIDHKSQSRKYTLFEMSLQALNYLLAAGCNDFMYNYIRLHEKVQPDTFVRKHKFISNSMLKKWKSKLIGHFYRIAMLRMEGDLDNFPNQSCSDIGFGKVCPYTRLCSEELPGVRKAFLERDYITKKPWEPWSLEELVGGEEN